MGRVGHQTVLPTGRDQLLPLTAAVGPTTPPGVYDFHLDIAGHSYPAKVHVTELVGLEVSPARLVIQDGPGVRVVKRVVVSNVGNVPVTIGASADVALRADVPRADAAQERLARLCRQLAGLGDEPGEAPPGDLKAIGHLKVRITDGAGPLAPGEVVELAIETTVPARLPAGARLVGTAVLVTADLEFVVVTAPPVVAVPPRRPNPAPRPPRKKAG